MNDYSKLPSNLRETDIVDARLNLCNSSAEARGSRLGLAYRRYGWRVLPLAVRRALFEWPRLRSGFVVLKIKCLLRSKIGGGVGFGKRVSIKIPGGYLQIGNRTYFNDDCVIEANPSATLRIGADCYFARNVHLYATDLIEIGDNVRIAEFTSLRDSSHNYRNRNRTINRQGDTTGKISIGDDVWIGQGCLVVAGEKTVTIGRGAVIGARSVVKDCIPEYAVAVGSPARVINHRG